MLNRFVTAAVLVCVLFAPLSISLDYNTQTHPVSIKIEKAEAAIPLLIPGVIALASALGMGAWVSDTVANWINSVFAFFASLFVRIAVSILGLTGSLFDYAIWAFASNLTATLETLGIVDAIRRIWVIFRDLSQIVLIGFFIFIAINIILNNHEYSIKQHAVRAILVALFMNFSLFFSMAVIDVSNFVAYQFYRGISSVGGTSTPGNPLGTEANISERIVTSLGLTGLNNWSSWSGQDLKRGSILETLVASLGIFLVLLVTAAALLYAVWLLLRRTAMLILLMMTSSLATAALIIPKFQTYFDQWKTSLLGNAFFAPLFLLMLWAVIQIMDAMAATSTPGFRPEIFVKPDSIQASGSILARYGIVLVLLVAAIKIADSLAKKGSELFGMNVGSMIGGGFGAITGGAIGATAATVRKGRLGLAERQLSKLEAAHDGPHDSIASKEAAREKLEKYKARLNTSGDFRDAAVMKALQKLGIQTGKPGKDKLMDDIKKKKKASEEKMTRAEAFKRSQDEASKKTDDKKLVETHDEAKQQHEVKSTQIADEIKALRQTVQDGNKQLTEATAQHGQAIQAHTDAETAANKAQAEAASTNDSVKKTEAARLQEIAKQAKGRMDEASANIQRIKDKITSNSQEQMAKEAEQKSLGEDMRARERRVAGIKVAQAREDNKNAAVSAFRKFAEENGLIKDSYDKNYGLKEGERRAGMSSTDLQREAREQGRTSALSEAVSKIKVESPATGSAPMTPKTEEKH